MEDLPAKLDGFVRALCALADGMWHEGGMSCTFQTAVTAPPPLAAESPSEEALMARFFDVALGNLDASTSATREDLVWELRRVVREATGSDLVAARVTDDPGGVSSTLSLWWRSGDRVDAVDLFWSMD